MIISVIIPCFNCEKFVQETLDSIKNQSYKDFEIIAIDDCSNDNTISVLEEYKKNENRLRIYKNINNLGVAQTRNKAVELAKGKYIAFLDADDVWLPNKLEQQVELLINNQEVDLVYTGYTLYDETLQNEISTYHVPTKISYKEILYENFVGLSTVVVKRDIFLEFRMNNSYIHEDYVLWLKMLKNGYVFRGINEPLMKYRVFQGSRNASKMNSLIGRVKILYFEEKINPIAILKYISVYVVKGLFKYKK